MDIKQFVEQRVRRMALIIGLTSKKIVKKEVRKIKKDLNKELLNRFKK